MLSDEATIPLIVDVDQKRPACVLLQAAYGCETGIVSQLFPSRSWLTAPTEGMAKIGGTREQWTRWAEQLYEREEAGEFNV